MNSKRTVFYALITFMFTLSAACSSEKKEQTEVSEVTTSMITSKQDTIELRTKTIDYLNLLRERNFEQAIGMLSSFDEANNTISPLTDEQKKILMSNYNLYPVIDYTIDEIIFNTETDSEIRYTIKMFESDDVNMPNRMKFQLSPKRIDGKWHMCIDSRFKMQ